MNASAPFPPRARPFEDYELEVGRVEALTPRVSGIRFLIPEPRKLVFAAGQFVQLVVPAPGGSRRTSYSISSPPYHSNFFELCVTRVESGVSSAFLHGLKLGDTVNARAPFGTFVLPETPENDLVFVATGSGIAPFRSMIRDLIHRKISKEIYMIFGNRHEEDIIYRKEWEDLERAHPNFHPRLILSRPGPEWIGARGYVQDQLEGFVPEARSKDFYVCGLVKMIRAVTERLGGLGIPPEKIHFERYD